MDFPHRGPVMWRGPSREISLMLFLPTRFQSIAAIFPVRLLHNPSQVSRTVVGYETWPAIGWHHPFVIGWSKSRLGLPQLQWIVGSCDQWEFPPFFRGHWQFPCTALTAGNCLPLGLCKGNVKESCKFITAHDGYAASCSGGRITTAKRTSKEWLIWAIILSKTPKKSIGPPIFDGHVL